MKLTKAQIEKVFYLLENKHSQSGITLKDYHEQSKVLGVTSQELFDAYGKWLLLRRGYAVDMQFQGVQNTIYDRASR